MKMVLVITAVIVLVLSVIGCTKSTPTPTPILLPTPTLTLDPRGSVLEFNGGYLDEPGEGCWGYQITARVQNLAGDGTITFIAEIIPPDAVSDGRYKKSIEVYLRQGEEKQINFHFYVKWPTEGFKYVVYSEL
jgi:hypothetical protein